MDVIAKIPRELKGKISLYSFRLRLLSLILGFIYLVLTVVYIIIWGTMEKRMGAILSEVKLKWTSSTQAEIDHIQDHYYDPPMILWIASLILGIFHILLVFVWRLELPFVGKLSRLITRKSVISLRWISFFIMQAFCYITVLGLATNSNDVDAFILVIMALSQSALFASFDMSYRKALVLRIVKTGQELSEEEAKIESWVVFPFSIGYFLVLVINTMMMYYIFGAKNWSISPVFVSVATALFVFFDIVTVLQSLYYYYNPNYLTPFKAIGSHWIFVCLTYSIFSITCYSGYYS